jgi:hypothetical protein
MTVVERLSAPNKGTEIIREGWFYGRTYLQGEYGDAYRRPEQRSPKATLFVTRCQERRRNAGPFIRCERTVIYAAQAQSSPQRP